MNLQKYHESFYLGVQSKYEGDDRPRVRVTKDDIEQSFLCDTRAQRSCMLFKAYKRIYMLNKLKRLPEKQMHIKYAASQKKAS